MNTKLSFENYGYKHTTEFNHEDLTLTEIFEALVGLLVGATFPEKCVLQSMYEYSSDRLNAEDKKEI